MRDVRRVIVVGASVAGVQTVESLREQGFDGEVILVEGEEELPYNKPPLSKELITGELDEDDIRLLTLEQIDDLQVELRLRTRATELDVDAKTLGTSRGELAYDALVIATGAAPVVPPGWNDLDNVVALRTLDDARAVRAAITGGARVVVVGGGFIGCEIAASVRAMGAGVTLVEAAPSLLSRALDPQIAAPITRLHERKGVSLRLGTAVAGMAGTDRVEAVELVDGTRLPADLVVVGLGVRPATEWLESSRLTVRDGICTDAYLNAAPGVYAAGDVVRYDDGAGRGGRRVEHWTSAREQGVLVAANVLADEGDRRVSGTPFVWSDQHGMRIQIAGSGVGRQIRLAALCDRGAPEGGFLALVGDSDHLQGVVGVDRPKQFRRARRLVEAGARWTEVEDIRW